jgi:hypothetical protein
MDQQDTARRMFPASGGDDDQIHLVDAGMDALLDPSPYTTRCGQAVFEVYNDERGVTCPACASS